jgi:hypothetical protein
MKPEETRWWRDALTPLHDDPHTREREVLRAGLAGLRERAAVLAKGIEHDLPDFTVHDVSHLDALWEIALIAAGDHIVLTPSEAFVFGGAVLLHDLGLGVAAYPDLSELRSGARWEDALASAIRSRTGQWPAKAELACATDDVQMTATRTLLRERHAERSERLLDARWQSRDGTDMYLLENSSLRRDFGWLIGRIAASHWWPASQLAERFPTQVAAPAAFPATWTLRPLLLACILRVADAAHIDARRAPEFERATRFVDHAADLHWIAQERLTRPLLVNDRLEYSATRPFGIEHADAWWVAVELLSSLDRELRSADALLSDMGADRLAAKAVADVIGLDRLASRLPTTGWKPVDASIHVSDVSALVRQLGGGELYGDRPWVPLRELIQNASDAIRLRRALDPDSPSEAGQIVVRWVDDDPPRIEVTDNGVGMAEDVLVGPLLDYGSSLWTSTSLLAFHPGAASSGFAATGRFGIGFFSVFMWGSKVAVASRPFAAAREDTMVLEFRYGIGNRPIVRQACPNEQLHDGGTRVSVELDHPAMRLDGDRLGFLERLVAWLCPASAVDILIEHRGTQRPAVQADDWRSLDPLLLLRRLAQHETTRIDDRVAQEDSERTLTRLGLIALTLEPLYDDGGEIRGRLTFVTATQRAEGHALGVVHTNGIRVQGSSVVGGVVRGEVTSASRVEAAPLASDVRLVDWAERQAHAYFLRPRGGRIGLDEFEIAAMCLACGGNPRELFVARAGNRAAGISLSAVANWVRERPGVRLVDAASFGGFDQFFQLEDDVLLFSEFPDSVAEVRRFFGLSTTGPPGVAILPVLSDLIASSWWPFPVRSSDSSVHHHVGTLFNPSPDGDLRQKRAFADNPIHFVKDSAQIEEIETIDGAQRHEAIATVAGVAPDGRPWKLTTTDAIDDIESGRSKFHAIDPTTSQVLDVGVQIGPRGEKYLETLQRTDKRPRSLLALKKR